MPPPGRYYNLGRTGLRVELVADAPMHLVARHFFAELAPPAVSKSATTSSASLGKAPRRRTGTATGGDLMTVFYSFVSLAAISELESPMRGRESRGYDRG